MSEWHPIETAPADQWVLVYDAHLERCVVAHRMTAIEDGVVDWIYARHLDAHGPVAFIATRPTHWMPQPEAPI